MPTVPDEEFLSYLRKESEWLKFQIEHKNILPGEVAGYVRSLTNQVIERQSQRSERIAVLVDSRENRKMDLLERYGSLRNLKLEGETREGIEFKEE